MNKENNCHMILELNRNLHKEFKLQATRRGMTLRAWVIQACVEQLKKERELDAQKT